MLISEIGEQLNMCLFLAKRGIVPQGGHEQCHLEPFIAGVEAR